MDFICDCLSKPNNEENKNYSNEKNAIINLIKIPTPPKDTFLTISNDNNLVNNSSLLIKKNHVNKNLN
jgi:hypothetical protein